MSEASDYLREALADDPKGLKALKHIEDQLDRINQVMSKVV
jgi:hypothetical protein